MRASLHLLPIVWTTILSSACAATSGGRQESLCSTSIDSVTQVITPDSLLGAGVLVGTVLATPAGHSVEYAQVAVSPQIAIAGHDGSFRLTGLPPDSIRVVVRFLGYHALVASGLMPHSMGGRTVLHLRPNGCPVVS